MKVGIITFYNGNINYGGMLQAYALQKKLSDLGYEAKQVCLDNTITESLSVKQKVDILLKLNFKAIDIWKRKKEQQKKENEIADIREKQRRGFAGFEALIPHTERSYRVSELKELDEEFDCFISGSDQVWTPNSGGFRPAPHRGTYFLDFTKKRKISYAASFGADNIPETFAREVMPKIKELDAVSVREGNAKSIIEKYMTKEIKVVVDPVMLLSEEEWNEIVVEPEEENYIFAYVLGSRNKAREIAKKLSDKYKYKLVTVPFIGDYVESDRSFGDVQLIGANPREFLGYLKKAKAIVTDSFHCAVFSIIFNKKFYLTKRTIDTNKESMNSRTEQLLSSFDEGITCEPYGTDTMFVIPKDAESIRNSLASDSIRWLKNNI